MQRKNNMGLTNIPYATYTWSPWLGCEPVSQGCAYCYATEFARRWKWDNYGRGKQRRLSKNQGAPLIWNKQSEGMTRRPRIFPSMCDWLDDQVPLDWLRGFLTTIVTCKNLNWLLLTKRPQNWQKRLEAILATESETNHVTAQCVARNWLKGICPTNVWFGITAENQEMMDERIPELLSTPAKVRWISCEPLLEDMDIQSALGHNLGCGDAPAHKDCVECGHLARPVNWIVVGGESGSNRRNCGVEAIVNVARQCVDAGVPIYVKQDCGRIPGRQGNIPDHIWRWKEIPEL